MVTAAIVAAAWLCSTRPAGAADGVAYAPWVAEAAARFALPPHWIWAVMRAESGFRADAVSPRAGAMGLMQVMPQTYADLRARYGLGPDPFDPRNNILAGAAYLREMHDRFGAPGFLAAYNAGPARYQAFLEGRPLPAETRAYVAALSPLIAGAHPVPATDVADVALFVRAEAGQGLFATSDGAGVP